jgi:hypothetical protein
MVIPPERRIAGAVMKRNDRLMAASAIGDIGVSAAPVACPHDAGENRTDAFRGYASVDHRRTVVSAGTSHSLLVRVPAETTACGHIGRPTETYRREARHRDRQLVR